MMYFILLLLLIFLLLPIICFRKCPQKEQPVDVLIVLGCPTYDDGTLSNTQKMRVEKAAEAIKKYKIQTCILTGGKAHNDFSEAQVMNQYLKTLVDVDTILEDQSTTTFENMNNCVRICQENHFKKIGILTSGFHLNRAYAMSRKFFDDIVMFKANYRFTFKKIIREMFARYVYIYYEIKLKNGD